MRITVTFMKLHILSHRKGTFRFFQLRNPGSKGRAKSPFSIVHENAFQISTEPRARQKYPSEIDENLLDSTLRLRSAILIFLLKIRVINERKHSQPNVCQESLPTD